MAALVTSGTATLETCLLGVPQVVCYKTPVPKLVRFGFNHVLKVKYISLVNLVADAEVVKELFADHFTIYRIINELYRVLPGQPHREEMLQGYRTVADRLGHLIAPDEAARLMVSLLRPAAPAAPVVEDAPSDPPSNAPSSLSSTSHSSPSSAPEKEPEDSEEEYELVSVKEFD